MSLRKYLREMLGRFLICIGTLFLLFSGQYVFANLNWQICASPTFDTTGVTNGWDQIVWAPTAPNGLGGLGLFVSVSGTGGVITSPDGFTWTTRTAPQNEWQGITWSPSLGLFVAVACSGAGKEVMTSSDGVTWTARDAAVNNWWLSVTWSPQLSLFVAVAYPGGGAQVMTSPDGINWTGRNAAASNEWNLVIWAASAPNGLGGSGLFVAVAQSGSGNRVMTSPDGINWTSRTSASDNYWNSVAWSPTVPNGLGGNGLFVAVNADETPNRIMTSPDGVSWTGRTTGIPLSDWYSIVWVDSISNGAGGYGMFVVTGSSFGVGREVMTSPNGLTWTARVNSSDRNWAHNYVGLCWSSSNHLFVACDYTTNGLVTSSDGFSWSDQTTPSCAAAADPPWQSVIWAAEAPDGSGGSGLFVSVAGSSDVNAQVMTSKDGLVWTSHPAASGNMWTSVAWSSSLSLFAAVAQSGTGNRVMTSADGINWTSRVSAADNNWQSVIWDQSIRLFVAVASSGTSNCVMTSPDGITWTIRTSPAGNWSFNSIAWSPTLNLLVAVGDTGTGHRVMYSANGTTWTLGNSAADNDWTSISWGASAPNGAGGYGLFVAVAQSGSGNRVMTSADGINWISRASSADYSWQSVTWSPELGIFLAVANTGGVYPNPYSGQLVMTSPDGISWSLSYDAINNFWSSVCWSSKLGIFAAVANSGFNNLSSANLGDFVMVSKPDTPTVNSVTISVDTTSAIITWQTNEMSTSQVYYGALTAYSDSTLLDTNRVFSHSVTLTGLNCNSVYHFKVSSMAYGNVGSSNDSTFTTLPCPCIISSISGASEVCAGNTVVLTGSVSGGNWSSSNGSIAIIGSSSGLVTAVSAGLATISYTTGPGCTAVKSVTVFPLPVLSVVPTINLCSGGGDSVSVTGGATYVWSPSAGLSSSTGSIVYCSPSSSVVYTITTTDTNGCASSEMLTIHIRLPIVSCAATAASICAGSSTTLNATGGVTYQWLPASGLSASTGMTVLAAPSVNTTYTVTGTDAWGCTDTASITLSVNPNPPPIVGISTLGISTSATLSDSLPGGTWMSSNNLVVTAGLTSGIITGLSTGTSDISYSVHGCLATLTVTVNPFVVTTWYSSTSTGDAANVYDWWSVNNNTGLHPTSFSASDVNWVFQGDMEGSTVLAFGGNVFLVAGGLFKPLAFSNTTVGGNWINSGGAFVHNNGTVTFSGSSSSIVDTIGGYMTGANAFFNLSISTVDTYTFQNYYTDVEGTFAQYAGTIIAPSATLRIGGNFTQTGGNFNPNGGSVMFTGTADTISAPAMTLPAVNCFHHLLFNTVIPGNFVILNDLLVSGNFDNMTSSGTIESGAHSITISGNSNNSGTFSTGCTIIMIGTGVVTMTGNY